MALKNEKLIESIYENFGLEIKGLKSLEKRTEELNKSWFNITFSRKQEKDFLNRIIPKIKKLEEEFSKRFISFLEKEKKDFLKNFKDN